MEEKHWEVDAEELGLELLSIEEFLRTPEDEEIAREILGEFFFDKGVPLRYNQENIDSYRKRLEDWKKERLQLKTPLAIRRAIQNYEDKVNQDEEKKKKRTHQKYLSSTKSFIKYLATSSDLEALKQLLVQSEKIAQANSSFDTLSKEERREIWQRISSR